MFFLSPSHSAHAGLRRGLLCLFTLIFTLFIIGFANNLALPESNVDGISLAGLLMANPLARLFEFSLGSSVAVMFAKCKKDQNVFLFSFRYLRQSPPALFV